MSAAASAFDEPSLYVPGLALLLLGVGSWLWVGLASRGGALRAIPGPRTSGGGGRPARAHARARDEGGGGGVPRAAGAGARPGPPGGGGAGGAAHGPAA